MNVEQYKKSFPEFKDMPDVELATRLYNMHYQASDIGYYQFLDQFGVKSAPQERGFFGKVAESWTRGRETDLASTAVATARLFGTENLEAAKQAAFNARAEDRLDPIRGNKFAEMIYGSSRVISGMYRTMKAGGIGAVVVGGSAAAIGGAAMLLAGQAGPQAATPEEVVTVPAGITAAGKFSLAAAAKLGFFAGSAQHAYRQGMGDMYLNMLELGVDDDTAAKAAGIAAIPYAAIEFMQFKGAGTAFKGLTNEALEQVTKRSSKQIAGRIAGRYVKTFGTELAEELLQEVVSISAEDMAMQLSDMGLEVDATYLKQRANRILITAKESAMAMALLPAPGAVFNASIEMGVHRNLREENNVDSLKHEGMRTPITSMEDLSPELSEDQRDAIAGAVDAFGLTVDEAVELVQRHSSNDIYLNSMDPAVLADNAMDATNAVQYGSTFDPVSKEVKLRNRAMIEQGAVPKPNTNQVIGLDETKGWKKAVKKGWDGLYNYGLRHSRIRNVLRSLDGSEHGVLRTLIWKPLRAATSLGISKRVAAVREFQDKLNEFGLTVDDMYHPDLFKRHGKFMLDVGGERTVTRERSVTEKRATKSRTMSKDEYLKSVGAGKKISVADASIQYEEHRKNNTIPKIDTDFVTDTFRQPYVETIKDKKRSIAGTEALEVYMAVHDPDKLRHLTKGNKYTPDMIQDVLDKMDPRIKALGDWMLEDYANAYAGVNNVYSVIKGKDLDQKPGYSRIFVDKKTLTKTVDYSELLEQEQDRRGYRKRKVEDDMTKERTKSNAPLRLDGLSNFFDNKMQVAWYTSVAPAVHKVGAIFNHKGFQEAVNERTHGIGTQMLSKWLQDIGSERTTLETTWTGHVMNILRKHGVVASLGFNVLSMMRQPLSTFIAMGEDPELIPFVMANFARDLRNGKGMQDFVYKKSDMVRTRSMEREIRKVFRGKDARAVLGKKKELSDYSLAGIKYMDQHTVTVIWKSAYDLAKSRGLQEQMAVDYADGLIEKTQPMADIMDLPAFFRGSTWEKTFAVFQNQINQNINYWKYDILDAKRTGQINNKMVAYRVLMSFMLPAFFMGMIDRGLRPPNEAEEIAQDLGSYAVSPAFLVGSMASGLMKGYGIRLPMGLGMFEEMGKAVENPNQFPKRASGAVAQAVGLPWSQPRRTLEGIIALGDGETADMRRLVWNKYALATESKKQAKPVAQSRRRGSRSGRSRKRRGRR